MLSWISLSTALFLFTCQASSHSAECSPRVCYDYSIPVNVTNLAYTAGYTPFSSDFDVVDFFNGLASGGVINQLVFVGGKVVSASYTISATICSPRVRSKKSQTVLLATHGLGYDRRYWDSGIQPADYNFVDFAIAKGYSVFFYDRLGTGKSSKVSGYQEPQAKTQLAILQQLTTLLRSGKYTGDIDGVPSKIVHVGHSFGSFLSSGLIATTPNLSDAAILTGISYAGAANTFIEAFALRIASLQAPGKWPGRDNQYVTWVGAASNVATFYRGNTYDKEVMWYTEDVKQPIAVAELVSIGREDIFQTVAVNFTKPVMILSGEYDFAVCGGNCTTVLSNNGTTKAKWFPNATDFQALVHPKVGHGINFSYNATGAYKVITDYLDKHGF